MQKEYKGLFNHINSITIIIANALFHNEVWNNNTKLIEKDQILFKLTDLSDSIFFKYLIIILKDIDFNSTHNCFYCY